MLWAILRISEFMAATNSNVYTGTVYLHDIHDELVVMVGTNGARPSNREDLIPPLTLTEQPRQFLDGLISSLPKGAVIPVHPSTPDVLYAGSEKRGYVLSVKPEYQPELSRLLAK